MFYSPTFKKPVNNNKAGLKHNTGYCYCSKNKIKKQRITKKDLFYQNFAAEIDIFSDTNLPDWVYDLRETQLRNISYYKITLCEKLREFDIDFKAIMPICIGGKWKFADAYLPETNQVVIILNEKELINQTCSYETEKEVFFKQQYDVYALLKDSIGSLDNNERFKEFLYRADSQ